MSSYAFDSIGDSTLFKLLAWATALPPPTIGNRHGLRFLRIDLRQQQANECIYQR